MIERLSRILRRAAAAALMMFALTQVSTAQEIPDNTTLGILIKTTLLTFNDANVTGNYAVLHAKAAKAFRDEFTVEELAEGFKAFREQEIDIGVVAVVSDVKLSDPVIEADGTLALVGRYELSNANIEFTLRFQQDEGEWHYTGINVDVNGKGE